MSGFEVGASGSFRLAPMIHALEHRPFSSRSRDAWVMMAIALAGGALLALFSDRIPVNDGAGFDGEVYVAIAGDFWESVTNRSYTAYRMMRVLPAGIVAGAAALTGATSIAARIDLFGWLGVAAVAVAVWAWTRSAAGLRLSRRTAWLGFAGTVGSFAVLRLGPFYPTLTDTTALALGSVLTMAVVERRRIMMWLVAVAATFTWPVLALAGLGLAASPHGSVADARVRRVAGRVAAAGLAAAVLGYGLWANASRNGIIAEDVPPIPQRAVWLSGLVGAIFVASALSPLLGRLLGMSWADVHSFFGVRILFAAGWLVVALFLVGQMGNTVVEQPTLSVVLERIVMQPLANPLVAPVSHLMYYGPVVGLAFLAWPRVVERSAEFGYGLLFVLVGVVLLAVGSESRLLVGVLPLVIAFTASVVDPVSRKGLAVFSLLALAISRFYLPLGPIDVSAPVHSFPNQWYFMNFGPWIADGSFVAFAAVTVLVLVALRSIGLGDRPQDQWRASESPSTSTSTMSPSS